jgi:hypothetical protein
MPSIDDFIGFAKCFVRPTAPKDMRNWISIGMDEWEGRFDDKPSLLEQQRFDSGAADASLPEVTATPRRRVSFSNDILTFPVSVDTDGEASQELVVARDGAIAVASAQKKQRKQLRCITFSSEIDTSTFEVHKDMTPISEICDEAFLNLQEVKNQRDGVHTPELSASSEKEWLDELVQSPHRATGLLQDTSFSHGLDTLMPQLEADGEASQELVVARDGATAPASTQKKKTRSISFSSETDTSTFEVYKDMIPTKEICDDVLLKLQEAEKQKESLHTTMELPTSGEKEWQTALAESPQLAAGLAQDSSFSDELDILTPRVAHDADGEAAQELVVTKDGTFTSTQNKQRSISFSSEVETTTFEVHKEMTPTNEMCDKALLKLQETGNRKDDVHDAVEASASNEKEWIDELVQSPQLAIELAQDSKIAGTSCVKTSYRSRIKSKQVSFRDEPDIALYQEVEDVCVADFMDEKLELLQSDSAAKNMRLQALMKDSSRIASLIGEYLTASDELGKIERRRTNTSLEHHDTALLKTSLFAASVEGDGQLSSVAKALNFRMGLLVQSHLSWL